MHMNEYHYQFYGRHIISNIPLPARSYLENSNAEYFSEVRIKGILTNKVMKNEMTVTRDMYSISSPRVSFQIQLNPANITAYGSAEEHIVSTVFNLPFSLLLAHYGDFLLHCSCLLHNRNAYAICAKKGSGKSLLAAHLCKRLHFLSDDTLCLQACGERIRGYGATKFIKLYRDAYESIKGTPEKFDLYRKNIQDKRYIDVNDICDTNNESEGDVKGLYFLRRLPGEDASITITPVASLFQKRALLFTHLVGSSFFPYSLLTQMENSNIVGQMWDIPFHIVTVPTEIRRMDEISDCIYQHICREG